MIRIVEVLKFIVKQTQWSRLFHNESAKWFCNMHLPYMLQCSFHILKTGSFNHRNPYFNTRVYDGLNRNDFKKGRIVQFLYQLGAIKQPSSYESDKDGRGYWIGHLDDDE